MLRLWPSSTESTIERQLVCAAVILLHVLLALGLLRVATQGEVSAGNSVADDGESLVVEFIAVPSPANDTRSSANPSLQEPIKPKLSDLNAPSKPTLQMPPQTIAPSPDRSAMTVVMAFRSRRLTHPRGLRVLPVA